MGETFEFLEVDLMSFIGKPLDEARNSFEAEMNTDDEVGVTFVRVRGRPPIPEEWGLSLKRTGPTMEFLSPGVPDEHVTYSYDMLVHEAGVTFSCHEGYSQSGIEALLAHVLENLEHSGITPETLAREFIAGTNIRVHVTGRGLKGYIALAHFEGFALFIMKITDQGAFFG